MAIGEHTLVALVLHQPGVLNRISGMFRRRGFNISSLTVGQSESEDLARMTFVVQGDDATVEQVTKQLYKLVDVVRVTDLDEDNSIVREMALVKVSATNQNRSEIIQISEIFRSKIVDVGAETGMAPLWFPPLHPRNPCPNTANKIRPFVKQLKISTFPVKAFWPSFAYHSRGAFPAAAREASTRHPPVQA